MLNALLTPHNTLKELQNQGKFTKLMALNEELKTLPLGDVWAEYCKVCGVPADMSWFEEVEEYEKEVLTNR